MGSRKPLECLHFFAPGAEIEWSDELHDAASPESADQSPRADVLLSLPKRDKCPLISKKEVRSGITGNASGFH